MGKRGTELVIGHYKDRLPAEVEINRNHVVDLSPYEGVIIEAVCAQLTNIQIGEVLGKSKRTIENRRNIILRKIGCRNTAGLVMYAVVNGIVDMDESMRARINRVKLSPKYVKTYIRIAQ